MRSPRAAGKRMVFPEMPGTAVFSARGFVPHGIGLSSAVRQGEWC